MFSANNVKTKAKNYILTNIRTFTNQRTSKEVYLEISGTPFSLLERTKNRYKRKVRDLNVRSVNSKPLQRFSNYNHVFPNQESVVLSSDTKKQTKKRKTVGYIKHAVVKRKEEILEDPKPKSETFTQKDLSNTEEEEAIDEHITVKKKWPSVVKRFQIVNMEGIETKSKKHTDISQVYNDLLNEKQHLCSTSQCNTFIGQASKNRNLPQDYKINSSTSNLGEPSEAYLEDTYNYLFQRHVDNLNTLISQHNQQGGGERAKTEVHIHPTVNCFHEPHLKNKQQKKKESNKAEELLNKQMNVITEQFNELNFEELNNNDHSKPVIVFNHVSTIAEDKFNKIHTEFDDKKNSRSPSPLLEVPTTVEVDKESMRPPF